MMYQPRKLNERSAVPRVMAFSPLYIERGHVYTAHLDQRISLDSKLQCRDALMHAYDWTGQGSAQSLPMHGLSGSKSVGPHAFLSALMRQ